jgi:acyl-coenzyme A synthetase/AMP-(fatty) acid ligase
MITYADLEEMALGYAADLGRLSIAAGRPVAIHTAKSPRTIALMIACLLEGRPVLLPSATLGAHALGRLVSGAGCPELLIADSSGLRAVAYDQPDQAPLRPDTRFMLTTSGSTGLPKVVPLAGTAVDRFTRWAADRFALSEQSIVLSYAPLSFDLSLLDLWATLAAGGTVVLVPAERATDGPYLASVLRDWHVAVVQAVPMFFRLLADARDIEPFGDVRHVISTGDKIPPRVACELPRLFPAARVCNVYGCTETNDSFLHELTGADFARDRGAVPIGRPLPGVEAIVVAADGTVLDGPADGQLQVRTPFQARGYLEAALDRGRFVAAADGGPPYFSSGDVVHRDSGGVYTLLGRNDFEVKVRGTRVNLTEIEQVMLAHHQVRDVAVVALPDEVGGSRLHALVQATPGALSSLALRDHCGGRLPRAAIPSTIRLVRDPLPKTATGKTDRQEISRALLTGSLT